MVGKHQKECLSAANVHRKERWGATKIIRDVLKVEERARMHSAVKNTSQKGVQNTIDSPNKALAAEGFLLVLYRIAFVHQDLLSWPTCLDLPRLA